MKDKIFKAIKCVLFMLPFVFVGGKTLYTILNENAKDSYGEKWQTKTSRQLTNDFVDNGIYYVSNDSNKYQYTIYFKSISVDLSVVEHYPVYPNVCVGLQQHDGGYYYFYYLDIDGNLQSTGIQYGQFPYYQYSFVADTSYGNFSILTRTSPYIYAQYFDYSNTYNEIPYVVEKSLSDFNNIGFGKIDFLEWFNDLFLNNNFNNVYSTFINSYLNYFLFVELVMFIPSVFHWVIHFFTEIGNNALSRSTNKEKGDD